MTLILRRCRVDPAAFAGFAFRTPAGTRLLPGRVHGELHRFLSANPKALVELPRDHGKTVQLCARIVWELGTRPGLRVKIVCATDAIALQRAEFLREAIQLNPRVRLVFPHLVPATPWAGGAFTVARPAAAVGPSVQAFGVQSGATGTRADLLVADDVVDQSAITSQSARDRVDSVVRNTLLNLLEPGGRFWSLSTPWHADDLTARLKRNPAFGLFRRAVGPDLEPVWPEKWPRAALEARRNEVGHAAFARGYHLQAVSEGEVAIRPAWVRFAEQLPRGGYSEVVISVDPAVSSRPGADPTAVVVLGRVADRAEVHCLSAEANRVSAPDLVEWLAVADEVWQPNRILFESNGAFAGIRDLLRRHARFGPRVVGVTQTKSKSARAAALAVAVQSGAFRLAGDTVIDPAQAELFAEMTTFPFAAHDDLLDAAGTGVADLLDRREIRVW